MPTGYAPAGVASQPCGGGVRRIEARCGTEAHPALPLRPATAKAEPVRRCPIPPGRPAGPWSQAVARPPARTGRWCSLCRTHHFFPADHTKDIIDTRAIRRKGQQQTAIKRFMPMVIDEFRLKSQGRLARHHLRAPVCQARDQGSGGGFGSMLPCRRTGPPRRAAYPR